MSTYDLNELSVAYTTLNAARTLGDQRPSALRVERRGGLIATIDPARDSAYYNRIMGVSRATLDDLDPMLSLFESAASRVDVRDADDDEVLRAALQARGFAHKGDLTWLETLLPRVEPAAPSQLPAGARVERWAGDRADDFLELLASAGVSFTDAIRERRREHYCTEHFRTYIAVVDDQPAAWATMFVHGSHALLGNALTLESHRRQGLHGALVLKRLRDAAALGLTWAVTDVEPDTASLRSCQRAGMEVFATEKIWERPAGIC